MFERPGTNSQAVLVSLDLGKDGYAESTAELERLTLSAGLKVLAVVRGRRERPDPALFAGRGKVEELASLLANRGTAVVIFNHELSPAQQRNLEQALNCRVIDRVSLILDIFAQRARSHEGKLQVELAQLEHFATRLVRGWTHLERQRGGIGMRGPGETQLETDRRLLGKRVKLLKDKLGKLAVRRGVQRRSRRRARTISMSLVGYTNAGKSTLFNRLTRAKVYAADKLFATLDTTTRRIPALGGRPIMLSDTVGFIRELPHTLIAAFRATLEEAVQADLLLHVVDAADASRDAQIAAVNEVLVDIGADHIPQLRVYNKIDLNGLSPRVERDEYDRICAVWVSAGTGAGVDALRQILAEYAAPSSHSIAVCPAAA
jgi:GTP-binding protein HflX